MAAPVVGLFPVLRRQKAGLRAASPRSGAAPAPRWVLRRATAAPGMASPRGRAVPATRLALFRRRTSSASPSMRGHATSRFDKYPRHGDEWIRKVGEYISLTFNAEDFTLRCLNQGVSGYRSLNPSCKLEVLNCLCDEALSSEKLRTCIDNKDRKCVATQEIKAATRKQKELKRRYDDMTKTIEGGDTANNEEANDILYQIKEAEEIKKAARNELEMLKRVHRTTPVMEDKGVKYWKLADYCNYNISIMRQEFDEENRTKNKDMWFMFTEDEHKVVEDHVTTSQLSKGFPWQYISHVHEKAVASQHSPSPVFHLRMLQ
ncbi:uncharacterized protein LOC119315400 isoform X2 [Triticum dicoccoides]|uniref:uncharacterized protein LOC119315400 isoform X2 n=1 Tax=Triticum dicoccoides TaxID=85692 RepID=UPI001890CB56|nr:uncharacterized protein LOC119315400 isoform X2 [Triticum dicoccoides]